MEKYNKDKYIKINPNMSDMQKAIHYKYQDQAAAGPAQAEGRAGSEDIFGYIRGMYFH